MNLINLQTFLSIIETGSLIRASERMNVTQSTVTARLKALEDELGQTLFVRQKSGAVLTAPGIKLRRYAEVMVELWRQARQDTAMPDGIESVCNIGCHTDLRIGPGQLLLDAIRQANPRVALSAWSGSAADIAQWLDAGLVDLAITYQPATHAGHRLYPLVDDNLVLVSTLPNSPQRFDPNYIYVESGEEFGRDHAAFYADADVAKLSFGSANWALSHILQNDGSAYLPDRLVAPYLATDKLYLIENAPVFRRKTYLNVNEKAATNWDWLPPLINTLQA